MAPHSSTLAWKIPWMEELGRLQSMGSLRVGLDWATSLSLFTFMHWRRKWQPTPVFLPGESQGWGSLVGCRLWGRTEQDTTEATQQQQQQSQGSTLLQRQGEMSRIFLIITFRDMAANSLRKTFLVCKANPTGRKLKDLHLTEALKTIILKFFQNKTS